MESEFIKNISMGHTAEQRRVDALYALNLLDTPASESFDRITRMASQIFNLPIAAISLTDVDRQWFKSRVGVEHCSIPRDKAACSQVAETNELLIIPDMAVDGYYADSFVAKNGVRFYAGVPLTTPEGHGLGALCVLGLEPRMTTDSEIAALRDLAAMVMSQIELQHALGRIDAVSGLPNRQQFFDDMSDLGRDSETDDERLAVLIDLVDGQQLDHLSRVLGSAQVDTSVKVAAKLLKNALGPTRPAYHVASTQFAFLAPEAEEKTAYVERLTQMLGSIEAATELRFLMTPVIGVAPFVPGVLFPNQLLQRMTSAAQDARTHETRVSVFSASSHAKHERAFELLQDFEAALASDHQLSLMFQPRIDLSSLTCVSAEALLRWTHPTLGAISPAEFIPVIENSPYMCRLTQKVLDAGLRQVVAWRSEGAAMAISVNISAANLREADFVDRVLLALERHGVPPELLELEVTESAIMRDSTLALAQLNALSGAGIRISIDDFGTGYSSLAYLQNLPASAVKIDQSFIRNMANDARDINLVRSMITLSHDLGYRVVAEGVETVEAREILSNLGCDEVQGYFYSKPLKPLEFLAWCQEQMTSVSAAA